MSAFTAFSRVTLESLWCKRVCYDLQCFPTPHTPPQTFPTSTPLSADLTHEPAHKPTGTDITPTSDQSLTSTTIRAAAATHSLLALWSSCQMWSLSGSPQPGCKPLQKPPMAAPQPPPLRLVFLYLVPQDTLARGTREWPSLVSSFCHRSSPSLCIHPSLGNEALLQGIKPAGHTWFPQRAGATKQGDSGTELHRYPPSGDSCASSGYGPSRSDAASAQAAAVKPWSFCGMKSQLPCCCALAPFQLHISSLFCRRLEFGDCFVLLLFGSK